MTVAMSKMMSNGIFVSEEELITIAKKYKISKLEAFGSVLRADFSPDSDIDLLITFNDDENISLFDLMDLESELSDIFNRPVDIIEPAALTNPIRRKNILATSELLYAA